MNLAQQAWESAEVGRVSTNVKGPDGRIVGRLSMDIAAEMLNHVRLRAQLHAAASFLTANPERLPAAIPLMGFL
jgi:hypothetical protein